MEKTHAEELALFRYGIIAPVINQSQEGQNAYFKELAKRRWHLPNGKTKSFKPAAFKNWLNAYRKKGIEGLYPQGRSDKNQPRKINDSMAELIIQNKKDYPYLSASGIYRLLYQKELIQPGDFSEQTLRKFLKDHKLLLLESEPKSRKKFEKEEINQLWTADFLYGPYVKGAGTKKHRAYLVCIIDDHSRFIVGWNWSITEDSLAVEIALKDAVSTYGLAKALYCDNGKVFTTNQLQLACAKLGIGLIHSRPYDPASRGKLERFFRTVRESFLAKVKTQNLTLEELKEAFSSWLNKEYHQNFHCGIMTTPKERYLEGLKKINLIRLTQEQIENAFLQTILRRVNNDSTVRVNHRLYEAPSKYMGQKVELKYPAAEPEKVTLYEEGKPVGLLKPLDVHQNAEFPVKGIKFIGADEKIGGDRRW